MSFPSDLEIASQASLKPLADIAGSAGIPADCLEPYGSGAAKVTLNAIEQMADRPKAKYVVVSAITPTPLGEGKTTTTVGLGQAFAHIGSTATIAIRQPSMGPTFGIKGGAAGGGYSQVVPMELFNLHLTGDMHAVTAAHNLCAAMVDAHVFHGNEAGFDLHNITWPPALVHTGPFGNIATGNSSIVADRIGIRTSEFLLTEAGFGADMGAERFFNIKCRYSGLAPDAAVLVATVRGLKAHSGNHRIVAGRPLPEALLQANPDEVHSGGDNLRKQLENMQIHGVTPVVAINVFPGDHDADIAAVHEIAAEYGAFAAASTHFADGGRGAAELAEAVKAAAEEPSSFKLLYDDDMSLPDKIAAVATRVYGADAVEYSATARKQIETYTAAGFGRLPVCIAKTHLSISSDPALKGAPTGWTLPVREVRASVGAGFVYPICGDMRTMPGLGRTPAAAKIDIDAAGEIVNLS